MRMAIFKGHFLAESAYMKLHFGEARLANLGQGLFEAKLSVRI